MRKRHHRGLRATTTVVLLVGVFTGACSSEPSQPIDIAGTYVLSASYEGQQSSCTLSGATLSLSSSGSNVSGTLSQGTFTCTRQEPGVTPVPWLPSPVHGTRDGNALTLSVPGPEGESLCYAFVLDGQAGSTGLDGELYTVPVFCQGSAPDEVAGSWEAELQ